MRAHKILGVLGSISLFAIACTFQACGGSEEKKDGGPDGNVDTDTGTGMDGTVADTGDMDTGTTDTGPADSGPNCQSTPCIVGLAVGGHHACALVVDGTVRCWGNNARGQIGIVNDAGFAPGNRLVGSPVDGLTGITQVAAATVYTTVGTTCARTSTGSILCLGDNQIGQLGLGSMVLSADMNPHPTPGAVTNLMGAASIGSNNYFNCGTNANNEYWCWGDNNGGGGQSAGTLGRGLMPNGGGVPGIASVLADAGGIAAGSPGANFNLALSQGSIVYSWGNNFSGQLGRVTNNGATDVNPAPVGGLSGVKQISAGETHACAVTTGGQVACWGSNGFGQLGRGLTGGGSTTATAVALPGNKNADRVACSNYHTCALATDGTVYCWGRNNAGQIGLNGFDAGTAYNPQPISIPTAIALPAKALAIGVGGTNLNIQNVDTGYSCALLDGGSVWCWGYNTDGELGRSADAGGIAACNAQSTLGNGATCSPNPGPVVFQ